MPLTYYDVRNEGEILAGRAEGAMNSQGGATGVECGSTESSDDAGLEEIAKKCNMLTAMIDFLQR